MTVVENIKKECDLCQKRKYIELPNENSWRDDSMEMAYNSNNILEVDAYEGPDGVDVSVEIKMNYCLLCGRKLED